MEIQSAYVISGLIVGFIVGLTGVGGGSLMTPILLYFGIPPGTAVGTDLLYAAITKSGGIYVHHRRRNIDWQVTRLLAIGSLPASLLTLLVLHLGDFDSTHLNTFIRTALGYALLFTSLAIVFKRQLVAYAHGGDAWFARISPRQQALLTVATGVVLGALVTITSIGAGAIGTVALFLLYPLLPTVRLVGTEIAHAVPLTLIAGLGHAGFGAVDWPVLTSLLMGSLPGIWLGSHLANRVADHYLRPALAGMLLLAGARLVI